MGDRIYDGSFYNVVTFRKMEDRIMTNHISYPDGSVREVYVEPADYFPKEIRGKYRLGEFCDEHGSKESENVCMALNANQGDK